MKWDESFCVIYTEWKEGNVSSLFGPWHDRQTTEFPKSQISKRKFLVALFFVTIQSQSLLYSRPHIPRIVHLIRAKRAAAAMKILFKHFPLQCLSIKEKLFRCIIIIIIISISISHGISLCVCHNDTHDNAYITVYFHCHLLLS